MHESENELDTSLIMRQVKDAVKNKMKNKEYQVDLKMLDEIGGAKEMKKSFTSAFYLLDNLKMLKTSKTGFIGRIIRYVAKRIYWIHYHSFLPLLTIQQDFNRFAYDKIQEFDKAKEVSNITLSEELLSKIREEAGIQNGQEFSIVLVKSSDK